MDLIPIDGARTHEKKRKAHREPHTKTQPYNNRIDLLLFIAKTLLLPTKGE